eukprot:TRINITY_DN4319_c0_g1_i1.p1 TRINITY_DN4319_c0_g1~~TRINITY_DN4319_c0_g1_i1.p1  ORF type:complete len:644 (-),score=105.68 TRINITY_DN4319_c0_g1_i1:12-1919(-)
MATQYANVRGARPSMRPTVRAVPKSTVTVRAVPAQQQPAAGIWRPRPVTAAVQAAHRPAVSVSQGSGRPPWIQQRAGQSWAPAAAVNSGAAAAARTQQPSEQSVSCRVRVRAPAEWAAEDVQNFCSSCGPVDNVSPVDGTPETYVVTFQSPESASDAISALNDTEWGEIAELMPQEEPEEPAALLQIYLDELQVPSKPTAGPQSCEVYLWDLPLEDYSPEDFQVWLQDFGTVVSFYQLLDQEQKPTDRGYVRFSNNEEAKSLIDAIIDMGEDGDSVKGSWSLSEMLGTEPYGAGFLSRFVARLSGATTQQRAQSLQAELQCSVLLLAGDAWQQTRAEVTRLGVKSPGGALHVVAQGAVTKEQLLQHLSQALEQCLSRRGAVPASSSRPGGGVRPTAPAAPGGGVRPTAPTAPAAVPSAQVRPSPVPSNAAAEAPLVPCILVRGIAPSWGDQQIKLAFAVFGGVSRIQSSQDERGRLVRVQLKNSENMQKAVDQLSNTCVGDGELMEECTITCELCGVTVPMRTIFIDELEMSFRPNVEPGKEDCEVFMRNLPVNEISREDIHEWVTGFGTIEDLHLIQDNTKQLTGTGYVRFATHEQAVLCIKGNAPGADENEGRSEEQRLNSSHRPLSRMPSSA